MKKIVIIASVVSFFVSCKEQIPSGLDLKNGSVANDTTYITTPESPTAKVILIEESTGNKCSNCPAGKAQIDQMIESNGAEKIKVMALHFKGLEENVPADKYYSLENADVRELINYLDGDQGQPCAAFNRVPSSGKYFIVRGTGGNWSSAISAELGKSSPVNIHLSSAYDASSNTATVITNVAFTEPTSDKLSLSLFVLEDGLIGTQDSSAGFSVVKLEDYEFNDVLRKAITPIIGTPILDSIATKEKGRVFKKTILFQPDAIWNKDNCRIIAVVHKGETGDKHVVQVSEAELK